MKRGVVPFTRVGHVVLFDPIAVDEALAQFEVRGNRGRRKFVDITGTEVHENQMEPPICFMEMNGNRRHTRVRET